MTDEELNERVRAFWNEIHFDAPYSDKVSAIKSVADPEFRDRLSRSLCDSHIDTLVMSGWRYGDADYLQEDEDEYVRCFADAVSLMSEASRTYYSVVESLFKGDYDTCMERLQIYLDGTFDGPIDEYWFAMNFLIFKNAFPKFWEKLADLLSQKECEKGIPELVRATELYYCSDSDEEIREAFDAALRANPDSTLIKEWYVKYYENMRLWNNAAAYLECLDITYTYDQATRWFKLGWCYGKARRNAEEAEAYLRCLELDPDYPYARNNLGYAYEKLKQYKKAAAAYKECIDRGCDLDFACTNYASVLITLGEYKKARSFIKRSPYRVRKRVVERLDAVERGEIKTAAPSEEAQAISQRKVAVNERSMSQFSSEKLLEDELEMRLQNGSDVFGKPLKIYRRKGIYGRQLTIPVGRLDLLAEDNSGNLYVIELKKDSGYDDAYQQTASYLDWLEKSEYAVGKNVYGIICLSDPTKELVDAVHADKRMKLFEYHISYTEI